MKNLIYFLMILFCGIIVSCDNDDIEENIIIINNSYNNVNDSIRSNQNNNNTQKTGTISFGVPDINKG